MNVVLTETAIVDLVQIGRFIAIDSPLRAETFVAEIESRCRRLGPLPLAYPLMPGHEAAGIRRRPYRDYLIFYRVTDDAVEILHVVHGAQDYDRLLFSD